MLIEHWRICLDRSERWVHPILRGEMPEVVRRALAAGASKPMTYVGAGASGVVLCDPSGRAFKVARNANNPISLFDEGKWLNFASNIPQIRQHVARVFAFDEKHGVLIRECVVDRRDMESGYRGQDERRLIDLHNRMGAVMRQYGFRTPEFKVDAYVYNPRRGPVLIDAGFGARDIGWVNARRARALLRGAAPRNHHEVEDVIHGLRMDAGTELPERIALDLAHRLERMGRA